MMEMSLNAWGQSTPPNPEDNLEDNPEAWAWMDEELLHHGYTYGGGIFDPYQYNMFLLDRSLSAENASCRISPLESGHNFSEHFGVPNQPTVDQHTSIYPSSSNNTARDTIMDSQPMADRSTKPLVQMSAQGRTLDPNPRFSSKGSQFFSLGSAYASTRVRQGLSHVSFPVDVTGKARRTCEEVIVELINLAFGDHPIAVSKQAPGSNVWHRMSTEVEQAFNITAAATTPTSIHILHGFVSLYFENFHPLWPMIWQRGFDFDAASPILYLTLTAIGSMYSGKCGARYGRMIHKKLCEYLMNTQLQGDEAEEFAISLCQSISLTQVTSLYFGQQNAFSDAQRLGSLLIGYARKFDFCNDGLAKYRECSCAKPHKELSIECLDRWVRSETRKRLVFAMLRADTFLTVLLNTRPLLSYEELNIELPCSDVLWMDKTPGSSAGVPDVGHTLERVHNLLFSDLIRIALDRYEALPILQPADHHMVLCGLQLSVWKFCHDTEILDRMTGENLSMLPDRFQPERIHTAYEDLAVDSVKQTKNPGHHGADRDHLDCLTRRMVDLKIDYERTMKALRKWKTSFSRSFQFRQLTAERSGALLSRLLYHVSFLRMNAAVGPLHLLAYGKSDTQSSIQELILRAYQWSQSGSALIALQHACTIWFLISEESRRPSEHRARFNILAFIALHHAAVVVWAFAGTHESPGELALNMLDPNPTFIGDLRIYRDNTTALSKVFENLLHTISPAWVSKFSNSPAFAIPKDPFSLPPIVAGFAT
jgi:hypothetical protein